METKLRLHKLFVGLSIAAAVLVMTGCNSQNAPAAGKGHDRHIENYPTPPTHTKPTTSTPYHTSPKGLRGKIIIVDPGHGGKDPGAGGVGFSPNREKVVNLEIAKKLAAELHARGARVIMTRTNDTFLELDQRAYLADKYHADLLISIHCDSHNDPTVSGATIYIARRPSTKSKRVAEQIRRSLKRNQIQVRGVRNANYRVLVKHSRPAVLIESGYMTNRGDAAKINNNHYQQRLARAIAEGVAKGI